jgi:hypothetical protein
LEKNNSICAYLNELEMLPNFNIWSESSIFPLDNTLMPDGILIDCWKITMGSASAEVDHDVVAQLVVGWL